MISVSQVIINFYQVGELPKKKGNNLLIEGHDVIPNKNLEISEEEAWGLAKQKISKKNFDRLKGKVQIYVELNGFPALKNYIVKYKIFRNNN